MAIKMGMLTRLVLDKESLIGQIHGMGFPTDYVLLRGRVMSCLAFLRYRYASRGIRTTKHQQWKSFNWDTDIDIRSRELRKLMTVNCSHRGNN